VNKKEKSEAVRGEETKTAAGGKADAGAVSEKEKSKPATK
jgi:hypothetical protein